MPSFSFFKWEKKLFYKISRYFGFNDRFTETKRITIFSLLKSKIIIFPFNFLPVVFSSLPNWVGIFVISQSERCRIHCVTGWRLYERKISCQPNRWITSLPIHQAHSSPFARCKTNPFRFATSSRFFKPFSPPLPLLSSNISPTPIPLFVMDFEKHPFLLPVIISCYVPLRLLRPISFSDATRTAKSVRKNLSVPHCDGLSTLVSS